MTDDVVVEIEQAQAELANVKVQVEATVATEVAAEAKLTGIADVVEANVRAAVADLIANAPLPQNKTFLTYLQENLDQFVAKVKAGL